MPIDVKGLDTVKHGNGKITARCPACAAEGRDSEGVHLVVYPSGKFACIAHPGDHKHQQTVFNLVGTRGESKPKPIKIQYKGWP